MYPWFKNWRLCNQCEWYIDTCDFEVQFCPKSMNARTNSWILGSSGHANCLESPRSESLRETLICRSFGRNSQSPQRALHCVMWVCLQTFSNVEAPRWPQFIIFRGCWVLLELLMVVQGETSSTHRPSFFVGSEADHTKGELLTPRTAERCPQLQAHMLSMSWGHRVR